MTTHYANLTVVPHPQLIAPQLLGALYERLHLTLVHQRLDSIGVSFPDYSTAPRTLGSILRLHASKDAIERLLMNDWLKGVRDHVRIGSIAEAPADAPHRMVRRQQFKTNAERLRRRRMRRKGETAEQAAEAIPLTVERVPDLPYVHLRSRSTGQLFCLFIALGPLTSSGTTGRFNSYGLAGTATVPWF